MQDYDYVRLLPTIPALCLGHRTQIAARALGRHFGRYFRGLPLTGSQFGILVTLAATPDLSIAALGRAVGMEPTTVVRAVQQLERRGLLRADGGAGRRTKRSTVTPRGHRLLARAVPRWQEAHDALVRGLASPTATRTGDRRARAALAAVKRLEAVATALLDESHPPRPRPSRPRRTRGDSASGRGAAHAPAAGSKRPALTRR